MVFRNLSAAALMLGVAAVPLGATMAQEDYPNRPITIIVPSSPGGAPDVAGRTIAELMSQDLGQPVVVENRSGASGEIGGEVVARAEPDGYTLLLAFSGVITTNPHLNADMSYDPMTDLVPVAPISETQLMLVVNPDIEAETLEEFVALAEEADPPLTFSSGGVAFTAFRAMESLKGAADIDLLHVAYAGGAPATQAAVSGEVAATMSGTSASQYVESGQLRALAATGPERSEDFPDLPTLSETYDGLVETSWFAIFAPAGTPEPILETLREAIVENRDSEQAIAALEAAGGQFPSPMSPEEFAAMVDKEYDEIGTLYRELGLADE